MYAEDDLLPISALQHLAFCERRCALIHLEGLWDDNVFTVEGQLLHERALDDVVESGRYLVLSRWLRLHSLRLGLAGQADLVEFHRLPDETSPEPCAHGPPGARLPGLPGDWRPYPVEYKRGKPKPDICYEVQLCAQALCLEEMLGASVPAGALYYGQPRRRQEVMLTATLRAHTESLALRLHELIRAGQTPPAEYGKHCRNCSLLELCLPQCASGKRSARRYLRQAMQDALAPEGNA